MTEDWQHGGFGIYIHWPFCEAKCPYCDFNSHVVRAIDHDRWRRAYLSEIDRYAALTKDRLVKSIFFGGGTPSLMQPQTIAEILDRIADHWTLANDVEITLEANPSSVEASKFADFHNAGVNRVSLGIQALNDADLERLGRRHTAQDAFDALEIALQQFDRASFDLICARQDQSLKDWELELTSALTLGFSHMSLYQLTIEDGTAFADRYSAGKLKGLPDEDTAADMYDLTLDICEDAGLPYYEVSNFSAPGQESRHNLIYWQYGDYIGIGPGAHGRLTEKQGQKYATETHLNPQIWLQAVEWDTGESAKERLDQQQQSQELLLMNLRLREGMSLSRYTRLSGSEPCADTLTEMTKSGLIEIDNDTLMIPKNSVALTNYIISKLASG